jgi:hypothetical protein
MRTIAYPSDVPVVITRRRRRRRTRREIPSHPPPDDYATKLVKYVPAETLSFFLPAVLLADSALGDALLVIVAMVGTALYLGRQGPKPLYFYVLAELALLAWIVGTTEVGSELLPLRPEAAKLTLAIAVYLIPAVDDTLTRRLQPSQAPDT